MKRNVRIFSRIGALLLVAAMMAGAFAGLSRPAQAAGSTAAGTTAASSGSAKTPKYIFLLVGDGMSHVQINAAQVFLGKNDRDVDVAPGKLSFTQFPVSGVATTHDSTSFCPDSASTATALSSGVKTHSGVIGLAQGKTVVPESITEKLKSQLGYKIGIISTVSLNHATPAAFYAHIDSRKKTYDIAKQLSESGFDFYAGGGLTEPTGSKGDQKDIWSVIKSKGYSLVNTKAGINALNEKSGKVYALSPNLQDAEAMTYAIDRKAGDMSYADMIRAGIKALDNDKGFFMMAESGKIDWACHANDAMTTIQEVVDFDEGVKAALEFAAKHPDETLVLVTGDHETGGLTIGYAATNYDTAFDVLRRQKMSFIAFDALVGEMKDKNPKLSLSDMLPVIEGNFGLIAPDSAAAKKDENKAYVLSAYEYKKLENAFAETMKPAKERTSDEETSLLYGGYEPLSVTLTHLLNNKAGIGWTSYAHTGTPVPVYAYGAGAEQFGGSYDNTDVFKRLVAVTGVK